MYFENWLVYFLNCVTVIIINICLGLGKGLVNIIKQTLNMFRDWKGMKIR